MTDSTARARYALAASQLGASDPGYLMLQQMAAMLRDGENGAQYTAFTLVQNTRGVGFRLIKVAFEVAFIQEPVFSYGMAMVSVSAANYLPLGHALVQRWLRGRDGRNYVGASVALLVEQRYVPGYTAAGFTPPSAGSGVPTPTVAHHLTFTAPAGPLGARLTDAGGPRATGLSK